MQSFIEEIASNWVVYIIMSVITFVNIIIPVSGSSTQIPLIAGITGDAHYAITIGTWLLMISCGMIAFVFRKDIRWDYFWKLLPSSIIFAVIGAYLLIQLPNWLVTLALFIVTVQFLKKVLVHRFNKQNEKKQKAHHLFSSTIGALSGFLQGTGLPGSSIRMGFLYSENLKIEEVRGTGEILAFVVFAVASIVRLGENHLLYSDMIKWTIIFAPLLFISSYLGRKVLIKLSDNVKDYIIIITMVYVVISLFIKIIQEVLNFL